MFRLERYQKIYVFDSAEMDYGFTISNSQFSNGSIDYPPFTPEIMFKNDIEHYLDSMEIEFGDLEQVAEKYVAESMAKLLAGGKSDYCVTAISVIPGRLRLVVRNRKILEILELVNQLDLKDSHKLIEFGRNDFLTREYLYVDFHAKDEDSLGPIQFSSQSISAADEINYCSVRTCPHCATVKEWYEQNAARRQTYLTFKGKDEDDEDIMVGGIEEASPC